MALPRNKALALVKKEYKRFMRKYFPKDDIIEPSFAVKKTGRAVGKYYIGKRLIAIHPDCFMSKETLQDTVWHEAIHHVDYTLNGLGKRENKGHGKFFKEQMSRINAKEGRDVITVTVVKPFERTAKPYYLHYFFIDNGVYMMWTKTPFEKRAITRPVVFHMAAESSDEGKVYSVETDLRPFTRMINPVTSKVFRTQKAPIGFIPDDSKMYQFFVANKKSAAVFDVPDHGKIVRMYDRAVSAYYDKLKQREK